MADAVDAGWWAAARKSVLGHSGDDVREALLNRTDIMCPLCRYLAQDYVCLGFSFPPSCLREACRASLTPPLQQAMAHDCARQRWPPQCIDAGVHMVRIERGVG